MVDILSKFIVLCLCSYFVVYFLELELTLFYYDTRIFLILFPYPVLSVIDRSMGQIVLFAYNSYSIGTCTISLKKYLHKNVYIIFTNLSTRAGYDKVNF